MTTLPRTDRSDTVRRLFVTAAIIEACTWIGLLVGMYLKYISHTTEAGVWLFGRLHGAAFVAYLVMAVLASRTFRWRWTIMAFALISSIPPLATLVFEIWARRHGRLSTPSSIRPSL